MHSTAMAIALVGHKALRGNVFELGSLCRDSQLRRQIPAGRWRPQPPTRQKRRLNKSSKRQNRGTERLVEGVNNPHSSPEHFMFALLKTICKA
jgi:hypothetical protein